MNKKFLWFMVLFLALPLLFAAQPISQAAEGWSNWVSIGTNVRATPTLCTFQDKLVAITPISDTPCLRWTLDGSNWDAWYNTRIQNIEEATMGSSKGTAFIFARVRDNRVFYLPHSKINKIHQLASNIKEIPGVRTPSVPSVVPYNDNMFVFFRGTDNRIYDITYIVGRDIFKSVNEVPGGGLTTAEPRAAVINNQIYLAVRGTDDCIYLNTRTSGGTWRGWQQVPGGGKTLSGPAIASYNGSIYLLVRGTDNGIYVNNTRNDNWTGWRNIGGQSASGPCLTVFRNTLYAVVRGTDNRLYISSLQEGSRNDDRQDKDGRHDGRDDDRDRDGNRHDGDRDQDNRLDKNVLLNAQFIENTIPDKMRAGQSYNVSITLKNTGDISWTANRKYRLGATQEGKSFGAIRFDLKNVKVKTNEKTTFSFTMTAPANPGEYTITWQMLQDKNWFGDKLTKTIKVRKTRQDGRWDDDEDMKDDDHHDHHGDQDKDKGRDNDKHDNDKHESGWIELPGSGQTLSGPASCVFDNRLYMLVRGTDNGIYINTLGNNNWSGWSNIGGATPSQGTLANFNGSLYAFVRGTDNAIYINRNRGNGFEGWSKVPGGGATLSGPAATSFNGRLYVVVRGTDNVVYINSMNADGGWSGWSSLGGSIPSEPAVEVHEGKLFVFARGTNDGIWVNKFNGDNWSGWSEVPGNGRTPSGPTACSYNGQLYLVVQGTDDNIWINTLKGNGWSGWSKVSGNGKTPSGASISSYRGKLFVFVRGTNNAIYQNEL